MTTELAPSPFPKLVAKLALLAIRKAPQSPTLMIQGVLGTLTPEEEATELPGAVEEEGWSSTLGQEDNERLLLTIKLSKFYLNRLRSF